MEKELSEEKEEKDLFKHHGGDNWLLLWLRIFVFSDLRRHPKGSDYCFYAEKVIVSL